MIERLLLLTSPTVVKLQKTLDLHSLAFFTVTLQQLVALFFNRLQQFKLIASIHNPTH